MFPRSVFGGSSNVNIIGTGDRFIPRRSDRFGIAAQSAFLSTSPTFERPPQNILEQDPKTWRRQNYLGVLDTTFHTQNDGVYDFSVNANTKRKRHKTSPPEAFFPKNKDNYQSLWPCKPRKGPCIGSPSSVYDLPQYQSCQGEVPILDLLDWSSKDFLIVGLLDKIYIMKHATGEVIKHNCESGLITCIKSHPDGTILSSTSNNGFIKVIDVELLKVLGRFPCQSDTESRCQLTSITWSPTGNMLATGCFDGWICTFTKDLSFRNKRQVHVTAVLYMEISPDSRYLATSGDDMLVKVLLWPSLVVIMVIHYNEPATAIKWHPWKSALLAIGSAERIFRPEGRSRLAQIEIWNVPKMEKIGKINPEGGKLVDSIAFNDITGEMVVSICTDENSHDSRIVVLSSFTKVVDKFHNHNGRVKTLLFNPDNMKLACGSTAETLYVWNYFGDHDTSPRPRKRSCPWTVPLYLAMTTGDIC